MYVFSGDDGAHPEGLSVELSEVIGMSYLEQGGAHHRDSEIVAFDVGVLRNSEALICSLWRRIDVNPPTYYPANI